MHATEVGNTVFFNPAPEAQFLAAVSMALAVIAGIMLPRIRDGSVAGVVVQALVALIPVALREDGFQTLTVDFSYLLSWVSTAVFYVQWLFVFLVTFACDRCVRSARNNSSVNALRSLVSVVHSSRTIGTPFSRAKVLSVMKQARAQRACSLTSSSGTGMRFFFQPLGQPSAPDPISSSLTIT